MSKWLDLIILLLLIPIYGKSQIVGSLLMLDNFYISQEYNPAYYSDSNGITIGLPILSNTNFNNNSNFRVSNFISRNSDGSSTLSFDDFENNDLYKLRNSVELPFFYLNFKYKGRQIGISLKETFLLSTRFKGSAAAIFNNGNNKEIFQNHASDKISINGLSFRELSINLTNQVNDRLTVGYRPKIVFGMALADIKNFEYRLITDESGENITLYSYGQGKTSLPITVVKDDEALYKIKSDNITLDYLSAFNNPGLALDYGIDYDISSRRKIALSLLNMGFVWFSHKSFELNFDTEYIYSGFDVTQNPSDVYIEGVKEELKEALRPNAKSLDFIHLLPVTFVAHLQQNFFNQIDGGVTNQLTYYNGDIHNASTISTKYKISYFDVIGSLSAYNFTDFSIGGGITFNTSYMQMFVLGNNLKGLYHPATTKNFSINFGVQINIRPKKNSSEENSGIKKRIGKFNDYLPFYKNLK